MASPTILSVILFHLLLVTHSAAQTGFRATLTRATKNQYSPTAFNDDTPPISRMKPYKDEYLLNLAIGTPPVPFSAVMDTGSDLTWTKCTTTSSLTSPFDPSKSKSFSKVNQTCDSFQLNTGEEGCRQDYKDNQSIAVDLGQDTLTIGKTKIPNVIFGCGTPVGKHYPYGGTVGMGRGKLSLVSKLKDQVFSYCLASRTDESKRSILLTGSEARRVMGANIQTMPLRSSSEIGSASFYFISLQGISVGGIRLPVTTSDFSNGMVIDSGTTFSSLPSGVFNEIKQEFMKQTMVGKSNDSNRPYKKDLHHCFDSSFPERKIPKLVFHFEGGADWELPSENYIYRKGESACLAIGVDEKEGAATSIFGNFQQQNMMVLYDLRKNSLSFMPADCNQF